MTGARSEQNSTNGAGPQLAFVVPADTWERIADLVRSLERQQSDVDIELVVVTPLPGALGVSTWTGRQAVVAAPLDDVSAAHALGVRAASAPVVFLGENHAFPTPGSLSALVAAFVDPRVACAVPRLTNANPGTSRSWVSLLFGYGRWIALDGADLDTAPAFNAAWRRDALLALGAELPAVLGAGGGLDAILVSSGWRLVAVPEAVVEHLNVVRPWAWLATRVDSSRLFATARARSWSRRRRVVYGLGTPVLAPILTWRVLRSPAWQSTEAERGSASLPLLLVTAVAASVGEALGYLVGGGGARRRVAEVEVRRSSYT